MDKINYDNKTSRKVFLSTFYEEIIFYTIITIFYIEDIDMFKQNRFRIFINNLY